MFYLRLIHLLEPDPNHLSLSNHMSRLENVSGTSAFHTHTHTFPITSQNCCQYNKCKSPRQTQRAAAVELTGISHEKERERETPTASGTRCTCLLTLYTVIACICTVNKSCLFVLYLSEYGFVGILQCLQLWMAVRY